jgi:hypothetical protein
MPMARRSAPAEVLPLLAWPQARVAARLEEERRLLSERIARLPRHAHYRLELEARLREITTRQMHIEIEMRRGA